MDARRSNETAAKSPTTVTRTSDREIVVTRIINGPPRLVFEAWTTPDLFKRWWVPKSLGVTLVACDLDVRVGGKYRLAFATDDPAKPMEFFGKYLEVTPPSRLVWTNDEGEAGAVTTVTFEERDGKTLLTIRDLYPTKEALDAGAGSMEGMPETLAQLDEVIASLGTGGQGA